MSLHKNFHIAYNESTQTQFGPFHNHTANEIIFVVEGGADFLINNHRYTLRKNSIVFISSFEKHELIYSNSTYKRYYILVDDTLLSSNLFDNTLTSIFNYRPKSFCHVLELDDITATKVHHNLQDIFIEYQLNEKYKLSRLQSLLFDTFIILYRFKPEIFYEYNEDNYFSLVAKVQSYLNNNFCKDISLQSIAELFYTNTSYLSQKFKEIIGCSFKSYLTNLRITQAKYLLSTTTIPVSHVALSCGYNDQSNFMHRFKKETGMTPLTYRAKSALPSSINDNSY